MLDLLSLIVNMASMGRLFIVVFAVCLVLGQASSTDLDVLARLNALEEEGVLFQIIRCSKHSFKGLKIVEMQKPLIYSVCLEKFFGEILAPISRTYLTPFLAAGGSCYFHLGISFSIFISESKLTRK